jgi:hypothetical protein
MLERLNSEGAPSPAEVIGDLLSSPEEFSLDALAARAWIALPVRDYISEEQARGISSAAARLSSKTALAATTSPGARPEVWRLDLTLADIVAFDANCMLRSFLLVPDDREFAILEEGDYYYVLAGAKDFLEEVFGAQLKAVKQLFLEYASDPSWREKTRKWLLGVYERYCGLASPR